MDGNKELLDYIKQIFDTKFDSLNTKLDLINSNLTTNHTKLEGRVEACEDEIDVIKNRPREEKLNVKNEIIKTLIHWGLPITILAVIYFIQQGRL